MYIPSFEAIENKLSFKVIVYQLINFKKKKMNKYYVAYYKEEELVQEFVKAEDKEIAVMLAIWYHCEFVSSIDDCLLIDNKVFEQLVLVDVNNLSLPSFITFIEQDKDNKKRVDTFFESEKLLLKSWIDESSLK